MLLVMLKLLLMIMMLLVIMMLMLISVVMLMLIHSSVFELFIPLCKNDDDKDRSTNTSAWNHNAWSGFG